MCDISERVNCSNLIYLFVFSGNETEAIKLLELGFNASTPDQHGRFAMHLAAELGSKKNIKTLSMFLFCL